jgi:hypothetical protein
MKYAGILFLCCCLLVPALRAEDAVAEAEVTEAIAAEPAFPAPPQSGPYIGGGIWGRYLRLNLNHWTDSLGRRMDREDLFYYGARVVVSGPLKEGSPFRWRFGGTIGAAGKEDDDINELNLGLVTAGLTSGLSWRPGKFGVSLDLSLGGAAIDTEIKRAELRDDWELYERRTVGLFYWEPLLSLDFQVLDIFVIRLQGGYTFLYGKGKEVGGPTAGLAFDFGKWI